MAHARARRLRTGVWWYLVEDSGRYHRCGQGKKGGELAKAWASRLNEAKYLAGSPFEMPVPCLWTLEDLHRADMDEAKRRGLRTVLPQAGARSTSRRESHWRNLLAFFGAETNLEEIGQGRIRAYIEAKSATVKPPAINRDLWGVLRPALRLARETEASGYQADPFRGLRKLDERRGRRESVALSRREVERLIRCCWKVDAELGAYVELLYTTASRLNETPAVDRGFLRYPAYKRGVARTFIIDDSLRALLVVPRRFRRPLWLKATAAFGRPVNPHDLRHTRLTLEGQRAGASLESIRQLGGWKSAITAAVYLHPDATAIRLQGTSWVRRRAQRG